MAARRRATACDGVPDNPRTWLISTGRYKAIDAWRKQGRRETVLDEALERTLPGDDAPDLPDLTSQGSSGPQAGSLPSCRPGSILSTKTTGERL